MHFCCPSQRFMFKQDRVGHNVDMLHCCLQLEPSGRGISSAAWQPSSRQHRQKQLHICTSAAQDLKARTLPAAECGIKGGNHGCALVGRLQQQVPAAVVSKTTEAPHGGAAPLLTFT